MTMLVVLRIIFMMMTKRMRMRMSMHDNGGDDGYFDDDVEREAGPAVRQREHCYCWSRQVRRWWHWWWCWWEGGKRRWWCRWWWSWWRSCRSLGGVSEDVDGVTLTSIRSTTSSASKVRVHTMRWNKVKTRTSALDEWRKQGLIVKVAPTILSSNNYIKYERKGKHRKLMWKLSWLR